MRKEQIIKDFSELHIGQNPKQLAREYYRKKQKEIFLLIVAAVVIVVLCAINDWRNSKLENLKILRGESEKEEISLQIKTPDDKWQDLSITLYAKEYSKKELEQLFSEACEMLPEYICNGNESLDQVVSDLELVQELEDFPFSLRWESSDDQIMDEEGHLIFSNRDLDAEIELTAIFEYRDWKKEYKLPIHITAKLQKTYIDFLKENLQEQEKTTREEKEFHLPDMFRKQPLQWRYPPGNSAIVLGILFAVMLPFISAQKDREIYNQTKKRKEQLQESFPEFISKMILLMEAGMNVQGAIFRIAEDYQKRQTVKNYLYEELMYICRQMKNGLSEKDAYELLAKRCNLACYKKVSGLLKQHLQKGGSGVLETLRRESVKASEEQKRRLQKKGEEMGTKLLFPMIMMLGIVMVFIMVPALFSFQIS